VILHELGGTLGQGMGLIGGILLNELKQGLVELVLVID
jgi:hypothetical protein